ncbi:hypothetical protein ACFL54_03650 [Planctomycetota bacterium]
MYFYRDLSWCKRKQGVVLLVVLGTLALLSALAISFVSLTRLERGIAQNYVDKIRAQMCAESGIQVAVSAIMNFQGGVLTNEDISHVLYYPWVEPFEIPPPLKDADEPSLDISNGTVGDGISGVVSSSYKQGSDYFTLRIEEESSKYNLNTCPGLGVPARIYDLVVSIVSGVLGDPIAGETVAQVIFEARDTLGGKFSSMREVKNSLFNPAPPTTNPIVNEEEWQALSMVLTTYSWFDESVITPTFALEEFQTPNGDPALFVGRGGPFNSHGSHTAGLNWDVYSCQEGGDRELWNSFEPHAYPGDPFNDALEGSNNDFYSFMDLQTAHFKIGFPRAPININTCKKAVIQALIEPVQGWYLDETEHVDTWSRKATRTVENEWFIHYAGPRAPWPIKFLYYDNDIGRKAQLSSDPVYSSCGGGWGNSAAEQGKIIGRNSMFGTLKQTQQISLSVAEDLTDAIWERIHGADNQPFSQWQEFGDFIRRLADNPESDDPVIDIVGFSVFQAEAVIANLNPNSNLNDYNPDLLIYRQIDKSQLNSFSNEICFEPTGAFAIQSKGLVEGADDKVRASYEVHTVIQAFEFLRLSTQAEFMEGYDEDTPDPSDLFYRKDADNLPETANATFSESDGIFPTAGSDWGRVSAANEYRGFSLMSYPEPLTVAPGDIKFRGSLNDNLDPPRWHKKWDSGSGTYSEDTDYNYLDDSVYDGYLALATFQPEMADMGSPMSVVNFNLTLRPSEVASGATREMIKGHDPETGEVIPNIDPDYPAKTFTMSPHHVYYWGVSLNHSVINFSDRFTLFARVPTPMNYPTADRLTYAMPEDAMDPRQRMIPGVLHPDGGLSDLGRAITYHAANVGGNKGKIGSLLMWVKPNFDPAYASRIRTIFSIHRPKRAESDGHMRPNSAPAFEFFYLCRRGFPEAGLRSQSELNFNGSYGWAAYNSFCFVNGGWRNGGPNQQTSCYMDDATVTDATNHSFPGAIDPSGMAEQYNFEGHKWNHIGISWKYPTHPDECITINGHSDTQRDCWGWTSEASHVIDMHNDYYGGAFHSSYWAQNDFTSKYGDWSAIQEWIDGGMVGPFPGMPSASGMIVSELIDDPLLYVRLGMPASASNRNYPADCTYDEVFAFSTRMTNAGLADYNQDGRYFGGSMAAGDAGFYTSAEIDLFRKLKIPGRKLLAPRSVSWTLYWPMVTDYLYESGNRYSVDANDFVNLESTVVNNDPDKRTNDWLPDPRWDPVLADIFTTRNNWIYGGDDEDFYDHGEDMLTAAAGSQVDFVDSYGKGVVIEKGDEFRIRLYFNIAPGEVIYETPILDDVTMTFSLGGPRVLMWLAGVGE